MELSELSAVEMLEVAAGLVVFVYLAYQAGKVLNRVKHAKFTRVWQPLLLIIGGTVHEDPGGGGATSWLVGTYKGRTIHARMAPDVGTQVGIDTVSKENRFAVGVANLPGAQHWRMSYEMSVVPPGPSAWRIHTDDAGLEDRLRRAGVIELVSPFGQPSVAYNTHEKSLFLEQDIRPHWVPPPDGTGRAAWQASVTRSIRSAWPTPSSRACRPRGRATRHASPAYVRASDGFSSFLGPSGSAVG